MTSAETDTVTFQELPPGNRQDFIAAWEAAFGRKLADATYSWIFNERNRLFVATVANKIAAGYCLYPMHAVIACHPGMAYLCNNVFVVPEYQSRMLFTRLGRFALTSVAGKRGSVAYGIPNVAAVAGHRRVGWRAQPVSFLGRTRRACVEASVVWRRETPGAAEIVAMAECSERNSRARMFSICKSAEFIRWRFAERPDVEYWHGQVRGENRVLAYAFVKAYEPKSCLHVLDIDGDDSESIDTLIDSLDGVPASFDHVNLWSTTVHKAAFERAGFVLTEDQNTLILIDPQNLKGATVDEGLNLVLADNDVY